MRWLTPHTQENYVLKVFSMSPKKMFRNRWKGFKRVPDPVEDVHDPAEGVHDLVEGVDAVEGVLEALALALFLALPFLSALALFLISSRRGSSRRE